MMLAAAWLCAWLCSSPAASQPNPAEPVEIDPELRQQVEAAKASMQRAFVAYDAKDFETAAREGKAALAFFVPTIGLSEDWMQALAVATLDSLAKLGRTTEHDALAAELKAVMGIDDAPGPTPAKRTTTADDSPTLRAAQLAVDAMDDVTHGRYEAAAAKGEQAVALLEAAAPSSAALAGFREMLANLYGILYRHERVEELLATNLAEARASKDDARIQAALAAAGHAALSRRELVPAERDLKASLELAKRLDDAEAHAKSLVGLAGVALERDDPAAAIPLLEHAVRLQEDRGKLGSLHLLSPLSRLGEAYELAGRFEQAEPVLDRALGIARHHFGTDSPAVWNARTRLGRLYRSMRRYDDAIALFEDVLRQQEAKLPPGSPALGGTLNHLAETLWAKGGNAKRTIDLARRAAEIQERNIAQVLAGGTEEQKRAYLERYVSGTDRIISYHVLTVPGDQAAARLSIDTILRRKGRVLDAVSGHRKAVRERLSGDTAADFDRLGALQGQLAALLMRGPDDKLDARAHASLVRELEQEITRVERKLSDLVAVTGDGDSIEISRVQASLPDDAVLVEMALFRPFQVQYESFDEAFGADRYVAYVIRRKGEPIMIDLGPAAPIDESVTALRRALASPRSTPDALARRLYDQTMAKIRPHLGKTTQVFLSPDGQLNLVPFAAMKDERGRWLVESLEIRYLSSGRDLMRLAQRDASPRSAPVVVGSPDFSASPASATASAGTGTRSTEMSSLVFTPLPGTADEVQSIGKQLDHAEVIVGRDALESRLKKVSGPVLLHIATHGFFLSDTDTGPDGTRGVSYKQGTGFELDATPAPHAENPLVRSGLALSGANLRSSHDGEDGILTALEVAGLDLVGTQLVVLSACETGVGEVRNGEGVYGLRRALVIAGARSQLMSLWQVDDEATRDLMVDVYRRLGRKKGPAEALRETQLRFLRRKATAHPFYWAAFIPSGDWEAITLEPEKPTTSRSRSRDRLGSGSLRAYWKERFYKPMFFVSGGYSAPLQGQTFEDAPARNTRSFDLRLRMWQRPWIAIGVDYGRHPWSVSESEQPLSIAVNRLELVGELDVIPLPYRWRVRPGLHPYLGAGLAWGRQVRRNMLTPNADGSRDLMGGLGLTFGTDAALYVRLTDRWALQLRGGVSKPIYWMRAGGSRTPYDDEFARAWRWQAALGIGGLPG